MIGHILVGIFFTYTVVSGALLFLSACKGQTPSANRLSTYISDRNPVAIIKGVLLVAVGVTDSRWYFLGLGVFLLLVVGGLRVFDEAIKRRIARIGE